MKIFAIYDNKSKSYGPVFECAHDAVAIRELGAAIMQERSSLARYPDDFELHVLAEKASEFPKEGFVTPIHSLVPAVVITVRAWLDAQPKADAGQLPLKLEA